ncbi:MAG TPA: hypothetical protein VKD47_03140 [Miltoncostaeaceae bacterium]|nr:hypothetical protein [Miltoncostaeaceae bacterium]
MRALRFLAATSGAFVAWLWVRGARDPAEWPTRIPEEIALLRRDLLASVAAGKRAGEDAEEHFESKRLAVEREEIRRREQRVLARAFPPARRG